MHISYTSFAPPSTQILAPPLMYVDMCVKLISKNLNPSFCPPYPTSTYTYRVTIAPIVNDKVILDNKY